MAYEFDRDFDPNWELPRCVGIQFGLFHSLIGEPISGASLLGEANGVTVNGICLSRRSRAWLSDFANLCGPHLAMYRNASDR